LRTRLWAKSRSPDSIFRDLTHHRGLVTQLTSSSDWQGEVLFWSVNGVKLRPSPLGHLTSISAGEGSAPARSQLLMNFATVRGVDCNMSYFK